MKIDSMLRESGWVLFGDDGVVNVDAETSSSAGRADYVLKDSADFPLCIIEAKDTEIEPLSGKEQARRYATAQNCRYVILSNGLVHYLWDTESGNPNLINSFPTQEQLELSKESFNPKRESVEPLGKDYIARTQYPDFDKHPDYINKKTREAFLRTNKLRILRDYQLKAVEAVQAGIAEGKDRFLLEMATGTGKTLTSSAIIKMFLRLYQVKRVLFLVDRIELERQAATAFDEVLKNDFQVVKWKDNSSDWTKAEIVVSTVQSFVSRNKYRKIFRPDHFDLVISDEAHRSLGAKSRKVFEYFIGFKLGLTATPKDFLKSVDVDSISLSDPRQLERRLMMDTYTTFGCQSGEPTFRYSLEDGVKDGYLINPKVIDARTKISTELLSEQGYLFSGVDEDGNDVEETFTQRDFEKKFFSDNTNRVFCETFLQHALKDPYTGEVGKTLVFCVSQKHAAKVTQILNEIAYRVFGNKYSSDFAVQVTSSVDSAQDMTTQFSNNNLNGHSKTNPFYLTSKTRVCVTVGMMTTGYDCTDVLNICMMRPVYSPSEFIQMKGRGTRRCNFSEFWISKPEIPEHINPEKEQFLLFDFFGNYEYFEKDFDYDEVLQLPAQAKSKPPDGDPPPLQPDFAESKIKDPLAELKEIIISDEGMKIDRNLYRSLKKKVSEHEQIKDSVRKQDFKTAEELLEKDVLNKPNEFLTMDKLRRSLGLDRKLTVQELLQYAFGYINHIPSQRECLEEEFDKLDKALKPDDSVYGITKEVFEAYAVDDEFRGIIDSMKYAELGVHPSGEAFKQLPSNLKKGIPSFIRQNVNLTRLENA